MSASYPYSIVTFPAPLDSFNSALMEVELTVANQEDPAKKVNLVFTFDSIPSYSPIIVKRGSRGLIEIVSIEDLFSAIAEPILKSNKGEEFKVPKESLLVPTGGSHFTKILKVIRHSFAGELTRLNAHSGLIDVTQNHSIFAKKRGVKYGNDYGGWTLTNPSALSVNDLLDIPHITDTAGRESFVGTKDLAWLYGLFVAEGSAYRHNNGNETVTRAVSFSNKDKTLLEKAKSIFEDNFHHEMAWTNSSGAEKIYCRSKPYFEFFRQFYTLGRKKKIPPFILNAPLVIKEEFLRGYNAGDGTKNENYEFFAFTTNSHVLAESLVWLMQQVVGVDFNLSIRNDKPDIVQINFAHPHPKEPKKCKPKERQKIKKIKTIPYSGYLYDLETADQTFLAGIGPVKVHNTGASISLAPKSLAAQLGLAWESGVPLKLQGVGGAQFDTYVHVLKATGQGNVLSFPPLLMEKVQQSRAMMWMKTFREQIGTLVEFDLPVAIADGEDFEFLLGMLGTIDGVGEFRCDNTTKRLFFKETRLLSRLRR